ncbi:MAG: hypothetical protein AAGA68_05235 [Pseudomonadota bacterium]
MAATPATSIATYAGVFILWDVLFGTYEAETEPVHYGVTTGFISLNPLRVHWEPLRIAGGATAGPSPTLTMTCGKPTV